MRQGTGTIKWADADAASAADRLSINIRDTNPHTSQADGGAMIGDSLFQVINTLNQIVSVQFQGSLDGTTYLNIGPALSVAATTGTDVASLTFPYPYVRAVATCAASPGSGTLKILTANRQVS